MPKLIQKPPATQLKLGGVLPDEESQSIREEIRRLLHALPRRFAPGLAGLRYEHVAAVAKQAGRVESISIVCTDYFQGALPRRLLESMTSVRLIPLARDDGRVRPLGLGHVLRRIAARAISKVFLQKA